MTIYTGKPIRDTHGRFAKNTLFKIGMLLTILVCAAVIAEQTIVNPAVAHPITYMAAPTASADIIDAAKIEIAKNKLVDDIGACETQGVAEPNSTILLDSNSQMSLGNYQFQIKTVQHYIRQFENRDITRVEAIQIAIDHKKAHDLAYKIIWQDGAWQNWLTCGTKVNAAQTVKILNSL